MNHHAIVFPAQFAPFPTCWEPVCLLTPGEMAPLKGARAVSQGISLGLKSALSSTGPRFLSLRCVQNSRPPPFRLPHQVWVLIWGTFTLKKKKNHPQNLLFRPTHLPPVLHHLKLAGDALYSAASQAYQVCLQQSRANEQCTKTKAAARSHYLIFRTAQKAAFSGAEEVPGSLQVWAF